MEASYLECPAGRGVFARLADTVIVVQGKEFPAHAAILARESQLLAEAFSAQRGTADLGDAGSTEPAQKRLRLDGSGAAVAGSSTAAAAPQAELIRLEEPFKDFNAPEVELFLKAVYRPEGLEGLLMEEVAGRQIEKLSGVIRLADFLNAMRVLERIAAALRASLPSTGSGEHAVTWASLLVLADKAKKVLPAFYETMLQYTTRLFGASLMVDKAVGGTPLQQLAVMEGMELSQHTWRALALNSLAIGRHMLSAVQNHGHLVVAQVQNYEDKPLTLLPMTGADCSFEWEWEVPANLAAAHIQVEQRAVSPPFIAANCEWQVAAVVPKAQAVGERELHLSLVPKSSGSRIAYRVVKGMTIVIKDAQGREYKKSVGPQQIDKPRPCMVNFISVAELQRYLRDGKLLIRVELEDVTVLDA